MYYRISGTYGRENISCRVEINYLATQFSFLSSHLTPYVTRQVCRPLSRFISRVVVRVKIAARRTGKSDRGEIKSTNEKKKKNRKAGCKPHRIPDEHHEMQVSEQNHMYAKNCRSHCRSDESVGPTAS